MRDRADLARSDREIARLCAVSHQTVIRIRSSLVQRTSDPAPAKRKYEDRYGNVTTMNTAPMNGGRDAR